MLQFLTALKADYCTTIQSQKAVTMKRVALDIKQSSEVSMDVADLLHNLLDRSHALIRKGADVLRVEESSAHAARFEQVLQSTTSDTWMFEMVAQECITSGRTMDAERLRCYTHAVITMPALRNGTMVDELTRELIVSAKFT